MHEGPNFRLTLREGLPAPYPLRPRTTDVVQGEIANCPIAALMVAMAHARPANLSQILGQHHPGPLLSKRRDEEIFRYWSDAYYDVVFPGRATATRITPFVYYDDGQVKYASTPSGPGWPSYIEKAYAVFKSGGGQGGSGGSYNRLNEKTSLTDPPGLGEVMQELIGGFDVLDFKGNQFIDARRNARPMTAADIAAVAGRAGRRPTVAPSISNGAERFGSPAVISSHGYAVLGYAAGKVRLQNPHGGPEQMISAANFRHAFQGIWQAV
jgi:hypothetical protein